MAEIPEILSEKSLIERDFFIYQQVKDAYNAEHSRVQNLDNKSNYIIAFVGILLSFNAIIITFLLEQTENIKPVYFSPIFCVIISSFIFLLLAIFFALLAIHLRTWTFVPDTEHLLKKYTGLENSYHNTLVKVTLELSGAIKDNRKDNQSKATKIRIANIFLILGILLFFTGVITSFIILIWKF
jgi:hypothetical protein